MKFYTILWLLAIIIGLGSSFPATELRRHDYDHLLAVIEEMKLQQVKAKLLRLLGPLRGLYHQKLHNDRKQLSFAESFTSAPTSAGTTKVSKTYKGNEIPDRH